MNIRPNSYGFLILMVITFLLSACQSAGVVIERTPTNHIRDTASQTAEVVETMPQKTGAASTFSQITIRGVQVQEGAYIHVRGQSDLPEGACILTQLEQEGEDVSWWPDGSCALANNGLWQLTVRLGEYGPQQDLGESVQYTVRAWYRDDPTIAAQPFPFDLQGPPPASTEVSPTLTPEPLSATNLGELAYVLGGDIWVKTLPDGEEVRLTTDGQNLEPRRLTTDANYRDELFDWWQD